MKFLFSSLIISISLCVSAQSNQSEYLEAKRQFGLNNYDIAKLGFRNLFEDSDFGPYASFYYALSSFKSAEYQQAYDMWLQVQNKFPNWKYQNEVNYWLARAAAALEKYSTAFRIINDLPDEIQNDFFLEVGSKLNYDELRDGYLTHANNKFLAKYLTKSIMQMPYEDRDNDLLAALTSSADNAGVFTEFELPEIKKDTYAIAVILPFMLESLDNPSSVLRNTIIWDLFNGMQQAQKDLANNDIEVELFPFDTKKRADVTRNIVNSGQLASADVIVGPLYNEPLNVISEFSKEKEISMVNPLSANGEIIKDNPYSYLFKPSYETQGKKAANYASNQFIDNKLAFVFYETERDSLVAWSYLNEIQKQGFLVVRFERLTNERAQSVQQDFTEKYEVRLDDKYSRAEIDSIGLLPGRLIKTRPLRRKSSGEIIRDSEGEEISEYYEERFRVKEDSIGHIFLASSSNLLANNFISLSEVRNDTIGIIGYRNWLDFSTVSYAQLERLGISFINPSFFDNSSERYKELEATFIDAIGREPGEYHLIGYELIYQLGRLLDKHGKYFQREFISGELIPGEIMKGLQYGVFRDNQIVPITKLENLELVIQENK